MPKTKIEIKKELINICIELLNEKRKHYEEEMIDTQNGANQFKGAMESRYDTFKEELQERKNHLAVQHNQILNDLSIINKIQPIIHESVRMLSVVEIVDANNNVFNYFIFSSFISTPLIVGSNSYKLVNLTSPLGTALKDKKKYSVLDFNNRLMTITDLF